ncbi:hypothetical protein GGI03_004234 [Coemansia sp. RSA 2337]|nr:hypothetical protein GGH13_004938 [Coemansia sp. S155-1]KAJ2109047.1 hypothetical protein IW146_006546 [Coemansia sp. RSA 922]KAJ2462822.1 hypothetical protein GGI03_004234 [Coemansia sp. RSA 2337]
MKFSSTAICATLALCSSAQPARHNARPPVDAAPVAFANAPEANQFQAPLAPVGGTTGDPRADRDARESRREERRKEWQEWARQQDENGVSNGSNFIGQILTGVSGIVDSALGPVYSFMGQ